LVIQQQLKEELEQDMDQFIQQYANALWLEERQMDVMAGAIAKALGGTR
jgi:pyrroline-5-carboxylate reductase